MSGPINILEVAARRRSDAEQALHAALCMNSSPEAGMALYEAQWELRLAIRDYDAAWILSTELSP
jgi:hypothetical protein